MGDIIIDGGRSGLNKNYDDFQAHGISLGVGGNLTKSDMVTAVARKKEDLQKMIHLAYLQHQQAQ